MNKSVVTLVILAAVCITACGPSGVSDPVESNEASAGDSEQLVQEQDQSSTATPAVGQSAPPPSRQSNAQGEATNKSPTSGSSEAPPLGLPIEVTRTTEGKLTFEAGIDFENRLFGTWLKIEGSSDDSLYPKAQLHLYCEVDKPVSRFTSVVFAYRPNQRGNSIQLRPERLGNGRSVLVSFDGGEAYSYGYQARMGDGSMGSRGGLTTTHGEALWVDMKGNRSMRVTFLSRSRSPLELEFDLYGVDGLPIRDNFNYCGEY